jgi:heterotetrameric sarcosine oxidase delta subunit
MLLTFSCVFCGPRDEPEFTYGGEPVARPGPAAEVSDAAWADYLYFRSNDKGAHSEVWCHSGGCGQWFVMRRDTVTHDIIATHKPGAAA